MHSSDNLSYSCEWQLSSNIELDSCGSYTPTLLLECYVYFIDIYILQVCIYLCIDILTNPY